MYQHNGFGGKSLSTPPIIKLSQKFPFIVLSPFHVTVDYSLSLVGIQMARKLVTKGISFNLFFKMYYRRIAVIIPDSEFFAVTYTVKLFAKRSVSGGIKVK